MLSPSYREYLSSKAWIKKKNQVRYWHGKKCAVCNFPKTDIHHKTYKKIYNENPQYHLIPLCRQHHSRVHDFCRKNNLNYYKGTEEYIKLNKKHIKKQWNRMTPFQRKTYLGIGL